MAVSDAIAAMPSSQTPYKLDPDQTLKASQALLKHVQAEAKRIQEASAKKNLLQVDDEDSSDDAATDSSIPIWLNLTTKQHIVDKNRLKPSKIAVPYSLNTSSDLNICIISADPQRSVKNAVADPRFPPELASKVTRIIGYSKLKERYKSFEQRRALLAEHDVFLADDRIVTRLPAALGKVFYKGTSKRPIPVRIVETERVDGKRLKSDSKSRTTTSKDANPTLSPTAVAKEIEKSINAVPVTLKPGTSVATRVGLASFTPQQLMDNLLAVVPAVIEKHVVKGWRNVKAVHIKSPTSFAIPIWLADELWMEDQNVQESLGAVEAAKEEESEEQRKRKRNPGTANGPQTGSRKKLKTESENVAKQLEERQTSAARKEKLLGQKARAFKEEQVVA